MYSYYHLWYLAYVQYLLFQCIQNSNTHNTHFFFNGTAGKYECGLGTPMKLLWYP
jgi:hypothetical protein